MELKMYRHYELRVQWVWTRTSLTPAPDGDTGTNEQHNARFRRYLPTRTAFPTITHREHQPTPKIPRPGNPSRNLPTPHTTTTVLHFRLGYGNRNDDRLTQY